MALDISALKSALDRQENPKSGGGGGRNPLRFSLNPGEDEATAVVRIVPYIHIPSNPFLELYFHYGLPGQNSILCPRRMEDFPGFVSEFYDCPLCEFGFEILAKFREANEAGKKKYKPYLDALLPKLRTHVPVVCIEENGEAKDLDRPIVQFWGIGNQVYTDILSATVHLDDNGIEMTDPKNGVFWNVKVTSKNKTGTNYPRTEVELLQEGISTKVGPLFTTETGKPDTNKISSVLDACASVFDLYQTLSKDKLEENLTKFCSSNDVDDDETAGTEKNYGKEETKEVDTVGLTSDFSKLLEKEDA